MSHNNAALLALSALTPLHPGAGRTPGPVDLPVVRDTLGIPHVRGSMIKGALKTTLARGDPKEMKGGYIVNCSANANRELCCLLGGEVGEGPQGASRLAILDAYPLAIPAPALSIDSGVNVSGIVYVTSASAAGYISGLAQAAGLSDFAEALENLASEAARQEEAQGVISTAGSAGGVRLLLANNIIKVKPKPLGEEKISAMKSLYKGLHPLYDSHPIENNLIILKDNVGRSVLESLIDRRTRVRIDRLTKTVSEGGLWREEYLPWGTLLVGMILDTGFVNKFCNNSKKHANNPITALNNMASNRTKIKDDIFSIIIGGKESIGAGLAAARILQPNSQESR